MELFPLASLLFTAHWIGTYSVFVLIGPLCNLPCQDFGSHLVRKNSIRLCSLNLIPPYIFCEERLNCETDRCEIISSIEKNKTLNKKVIYSVHYHAARAWFVFRQLFQTGFWPYSSENFLCTSLTKDSHKNPQKILALRRLQDEWCPNLCQANRQPGQSGHPRQNQFRQKKTKFFMDWKFSSSISTGETRKERWQKKNSYKTFWLR